MDDPSPGSGRSPRQVVGLVLGVALSVGLLVGLVVWVGPAEVLGSLSDVRPGPALLAVLAALVAIAFRHAAYELLYRSADAGPAGVRFHLLIMFAGIPRWLLPVGYVGGPAINAAYLKRGIGARFEATTAAFATVEFFAVVTSLVVVAVGVVVLLVTGGTADELGPIVAILLGLAAVVGVGLLLARSDRLGRAVLRLRLTALAVVERFAVTRRLRDRFGQRIGEGTERFLASLRTVAADRRRLYAAVAIAGAGWFVGVLPLYFAVQAVGGSIPVGVTMVVVPIAALAGIVPVPAGLGSTEASLAGLLVVLTVLSADTATAATLVFRLATLGLELALALLSGGLLAVAAGRRAAAG